MKGKCCSQIHLFTQSWSSDLLKGVLPDVENGLLKGVLRIVQLLLLVDPTVEQRGGNAGGLLVPGGLNYWYQEAWLVPQVQPTIHPEPGGGGMDPSPSSQIAATPTPPIEDASADKTVCALDWRKGVLREMFFFFFFLGSSVKPCLPLVTATADNSWICQILQRSGLWCGLSVPQPISSQVGGDFSGATSGYRRLILCLLWGRRPVRLGIPKTSALFKGFSN